MIYFATVHWKMKIWIEIQLKFIKQFTPYPYKIYCLSTGINFDKYKSNFYFIKNSENPIHSDKLDLLAKKILSDGENDDIIIFIDGDAFLISSYIPFIKKKIKKHKLVAIRRDENKDIIPHPSFCATTIGFWKKIRGTWDRGQIRNLGGLLIDDFGVDLFKKLKKKEVNWYPLLRTNKKNFHKIFFGIYENIIYHHGAGFRTPFCRYDFKKYHYILNKFKICKGLGFKILDSIQKYRMPYVIKKNEVLIERVIRMIKKDDKFYKIFNNEI